MSGISQNSLDWLLIEQGLKIIEFNYYKILNKTTVKTLNSSIYCKINSVIKGSTFFIKPQQNKPFLKQTIRNTFNPLLFELLILKFNNKIYTVNSLKNIHTLNYRETKLILYQFNLTYIKTCYRFSK